MRFPKFQAEKKSIYGLANGQLLSKAPGGEFGADIEEIRDHIKEARHQLSVFCAQLAELEAEAKRRKLRIEKWQTTKLEIEDALGRIPSRVN